MMAVQPPQCSVAAGTVEGGGSSIRETSFLGRLKTESQTHSVLVPRQLLRREVLKQ